MLASLENTPALTPFGFYEEDPRDLAVIYYAARQKSGSRPLDENQELSSLFLIDYGSGAVAIGMVRDDALHHVDESDLLGLVEIA